MENMENKIGNLLSLTAILILIFVTYFGFTHLNTWHDEIFSMWISNLPFNEFTAAVTQDVHPPLYYFIYKCFIKFFSLFGITNLTFIGKIVSLIPMYLLILFSFIKVKNNFGSLINGLFIFSIITMPLFIKYALEVRMYSWTFLFVTASFVYIYEIIQDSSYKNWAILTFLMVCSCYTQYFSALSSVILYVLFLFYIVFNNRLLLKKYFISAFLVIILYLPWIPIAYNQFKVGQGGFWIPPITLDTIIGYIYCVFCPIPKPEIIGIAFLIILICLIIYSFKNMDGLNYYALNGILAFVLVPVIGLIMSYLFFPIFHYRYLLPLLGTFWLSISILISRLYENRKIFVVFLCIILIMGAIGTVNSINNEQNDFNDTLHKNETLHSLVGCDNIIIFDNNVLYLDFGNYFLKYNDCYLINQSNASAEILAILNDSSIQSKAANGSKVYYIDCFSKGDYSNYDECSEKSIVLSEIYCPYPKEYIRDFKIYEIGNAV